MSTGCMPFCERDQPVYSRVCFYKPFKLFPSSPWILLNRFGLLGFCYNSAWKGKRRLWRELFGGPCGWHTRTLTQMSVCLCVCLCVWCCSPCFMESNLDGYSKPLSKRWNDETTNPLTETASIKAFNRSKRNAVFDTGYVVRPPPALLALCPVWLNKDLDWLSHCYWDSNSQSTYRFSHRLPSYLGCAESNERRLESGDNGKQR